jgi:hypothetical protein
MRRTIARLALVLCGLGLGVAVPATAAFASTPPSKYTYSTDGRIWRTDYFDPIKKVDPNKWCQDHGYDGGFLSGNGYWGCTIEVTPT